MAKKKVLELKIKSADLKLVEDIHHHFVQLIGEISATSEIELDLKSWYEE